MNKKPAYLPAFGPGQKGLLAEQMNQGFGGGEQKWKGLLGQAFNPTPVPNMVYGGGLQTNGGAKGNGYKPTDAESLLYSQYRAMQMEDPRRAQGMISGLSPEALEYLAQHYNPGYST